MSSLKTVILRLLLVLAEVYSIKLSTGGSLVAGCFLFKIASYKELTFEPSDDMSTNSFGSPMRSSSFAA